MNPIFLKDGRTFKPPMDPAIEHGTRHGAGNQRASQASDTLSGAGFAAIFLLGSG
jgi:hypothetical protein